MTFATASLCGCALLAADAVRAQDLRWRATAEGGWQVAPERDGTRLDPDGTLVDAEVRRASGALNLQGQATRGPLSASADLWFEASHDRERGDEQRVDVSEALVDYSFGEASSLGAGATIARWGTGYVWNPANPVLDPDANNTSRARPYRRDGDPFVRAETSVGKDTVGVYLTHFRQNDPLLSPEREREWALYARYQHVLDGGDVTGFLSFGEGEQFAGVAASATYGEKLELHGELGVRSRRRAPRIETVDVPTGPDSVAALPTWDFRPRDRLTPALLAGGQYTFENRSNLIVEYFYNGNGYSSREMDRLHDAADAGARLFGGPLDAAGRGFLLDANRLVGRLGRHYLFVRVAREELLRDLDAHYYLRVGLADGAQVHGAYLRYALGQRARAQLGAEFYTGPARSEARLIPIRHRVDATLSFDF